jgi:putative SOS response-associated peptidase YedK
MCFHYSLTKERTEIELLLHANWDDADWFPVYHADGFTFPAMPLITQAEPGKIRLFHWGLIPHWVKTKAAADQLRTQTLNARAETIFEKPSFRSYITHQRCLVIADGFFEWMDFQKKKYPHYIYLDGRSLFCFAGIYSHWTDTETGEHLTTFSIITTEANPLLSRIHNLKQRMPVILSPEHVDKWLQPGLSKEEINGLLRPYPDTGMQSHTITKLITSRTHDSNVPEVTDRYSYPELQSLF